MAGSTASTASASSPNGLTPRPLARGMRDQHVQALDPVGHAAAGEVGPQRFDRVPLGEIRLVRAPVGRGQLRVRGKPVGHVAHQPSDSSRLAAAVSTGWVR